MGKKVTPEQAEEILKCQQDVVYWVSTYGWLKHTTKGAIRWDKPYPYQVELLRKLQAGEDVFVLKSRRVGASWTCCAFALWLVLFHPDQTVLLLSRKEFYAKGLLRRVKYIHNHLPVWMRRKTGTNSTEELSLIFASGDEISESNVISLTTTDESGRGEDAGFVLMDEAAFIPNAEDTWSAVGPAGAFGGQRAIVSTPNGTGGFFHRIVSLLKAGLEKEFVYIEAHWKRNCGLSDAWFRKASKGQSTQKILQEFEMVFLSTGAPYFDVVAVQNCYRPPGENPEIAKIMLPTKMNFTGVDASEGHVRADRSDPDFHSIVTLNEHGIQTFAWHDNKMSLRQFAGHVQETEGELRRIEGVPTSVHRQHPGVMAIEQFGPGDVVINNHSIPIDGRSRVVPRRMTNALKMRILNRLRMSLNNGAITVTDDFTYRCLLSFEDQTSGVVEKAGAAPGTFDDPVIALALANAELHRWGGLNFDMSVLGDADQGKRVVGSIKAEDLTPADLGEILPVGNVLHGPIPSGDRDRWPGGKRLTNEPNFDAIRRGRARLPPPGLR